MSTISLCMIVKNEERFLRQCLESVKDLVDEMIIVDTGSTDKTKEIAKEFNAKIFDFKWDRDFSAARNFSLGKATGDWVLVLDADETIARQDIQRTKALTDIGGFDGFFFTIRNYASFQQIFNWEKHFDSYEEGRKYETWNTAETIRMFKRSKKHKFKGKVNEKVDIPKGKIAITHIPIHHFAWDRFASHRMQRRIAMKKKALQLLKSNPADIRANYELARLQIQESDFKSAEKTLNKAVQAYEKQSAQKKKNFKGWLLYESLAQAYLLLNENQKAIDTLKECIKDEPNNPSTNALLAHCLAITGKFEESNEHFRKALHFWRNNPIMMISLDTFFNSYGIELLNTGKLKEAAHAFGEAFKANPLNANAYNNMGVTLLRMKNPKNALIVFRKAVELGHPSKDEIVIVIDKVEAMMKK